MDKEKEDRAGAAAMKLIFTLVGKNNIKKFTDAFLNAGKKFKDQYILQPGEVEVIGIISERDGNIYIMTATVDEDDKLIRFENLHPAADLIDLIINPKK